MFLTYIYWTLLWKSYTCSISFFYKVLSAIKCDSFVAEARGFLSSILLIHVLIEENTEEATEICTNEFFRISRKAILNVIH